MVVVVVTEQEANNLFELIKSTDLKIFYTKTLWNSVLSANNQSRS